MGFVLTLLIGWLIFLSYIVYDLSKTLRETVKNIIWLHKWTTDAHKTQIDINKGLISELERKHKNECPVCNNDVFAGYDGWSARDDDI